MIREVESICNKGLVRESNQDSILCRNNNPRGIFVVADGMGGYTDGEIASGMIAQGLSEWWDKQLSESGGKGIYDIIPLCERKLLEINRSIYEDFQNRNIFGGSTVVVLLVWDDYYAILHSGDSRAYRIANKKMEQLTVDDIWDNLESTQTMFTQSEIESSDNSGKLTLSMGILDDTTIHISTRRIEKGDLILLCSDGVFRYCSEDRMKSILPMSFFNHNLSEKMKELEKEVQKNGAKDNYSAILCSLE